MPIIKFSEEILSAHGSWARESQRRAEERGARFEAFQSEMRLLETDGRLQKWATRMGPMWLPATDTIYPWGAPEVVRWYRVQEHEQPAIREGDVVIDCGGHVGDSTNAALTLGARLVITVEPDPDNATCIRRNLADEIEAGRVIVVEKGVWDREDVLRLRRVGSSQSSHVVAEAAVNPAEPTLWESVLFGLAGLFASQAHDHSHGEATETINVALTTVDQIVEDLGLDRVDFIKMDIEGAEQRALLGARQTIQRFRPRMALASYHLADDVEMIPQLVEQARDDYGMTCYRCLPFRGKLMPHMLYFY